MKTPMQELEIFIGHQIMESRNTDVQVALSGISQVIRLIHLEKEKQMIIDAYIKGQVKYAKTGVDGQTGEQYYNENFKQ